MAKYEKGRRCLVLKSPLNPEVIGNVIVLGQRCSKLWDPDKMMIWAPQETYWISDPPTLATTVVLMNPIIAWPEKSLLPLDDPDDAINKELQIELLETQPKERVQET